MSLEINGEIIEDDIINHEFAHVKKQYQHFKTEPPSDEDLLVLVKENLTRKTILRQEAQKLDLEINEEEIRREIALYKAKHSKMNEDDEVKFRSYLINQFKINHLISQVVKDISLPEEKHLKIFFQENRQNYFVKKGYDFIEVGVGKVSPSSSANQEVKKKLILLKNHFVKSPDYQEKIKKYLGEQSYSKEWKLFQEDNLNPLINEKLSRLNIGETTAIDEEEKAFYFLYLEKIHRSYSPTFAEVRKQVNKDLVFELEERKIDIFVRKLIDRGKVIDTQFI